MADDHDDDVRVVGGDQPRPRRSTDPATIRSQRRTAASATGSRRGGEATVTEERAAEPGAAGRVGPPAAEVEQRQPHADAEARRPGASPGPALTGQAALAIVAVLGVIGTLVFGLLFGLQIGSHKTVNVGEGSGAEQDMKRTAETFITAYTNFDGDSVEQSFNKLRALVTGNMVDTVNRTLTDDLAANLKKVNASFRGDLQDLYVQNFHRDHGEVFGVVQVQYANNKTPQTGTDKLQMDLKLRKVDGDWKVSDAGVIGNLGGGLTLPSGSSSSGSSGSSSTTG